MSQLDIPPERNPLREIDRATATGSGWIYRLTCGHRVWSAVALFDHVLCGECLNRMANGAVPVVDA